MMTEHKTANSSSWRTRLQYLALAFQVPGGVHRPLAPIYTRVSTVIFIFLS